MACLLLSRRSLLGLGAGLLGLPAGAREAPLSLPTLEMLDAGRLIERSGLAAHARLERLGTSRDGRPIDLISVGRGPRSALIVGAPHPNEPIGCLTIERMLRRLGADARYREESGYRWSFIAAIDADGIALNQGWFAAPLDVESYCHHFYRPPFNRQPEYAFPLSVGSYRFDDATPEALAWQRALALTRPHLQCSLHGSDSGGSFFICSRNLPALSQRLAVLPARHGIALNRVGEPFSDMELYQPGVLSFFDIPALIRKSQSEGADPKAVWDAGDSSNGYAQTHYETFSMTCEVPLWSDARSDNASRSAFSTVDTLEAQIRVYAEDLRLLADALPRLRTDAGTFAIDALRASLEEALSQAERQPAQLRRLQSSQDPGAKLSYQELVEYEPGSSAWRTPAMLGRLARLLKQPRLAARAHHLLERRLTAQRRTARLTPIPLLASSSLQIAAIDTAARQIAQNT